VDALQQKEPPLAVVAAGHVAQQLNVARHEQVGQLLERGLVLHRRSPSSSWSASRLSARRFHDLTVPSGAPRRAAISTCVKSSN
jgi:hypothetical protein